MKQCPSCGKRISNYAFVCPTCGFDLAQGIPAVPDTKTTLFTSKNSPTWKPNIKTIILALLAVVGVVVIGYVSQPLHGEDKIAYDLITSSEYFRNAQEIEVLSGCAGTTYAYLTISYTDSEGNRVTGHYRITEDGVTDMQKAIDEAKRAIDRAKRIDEEQNNIESMRAVQKATVECIQHENSLELSKHEHSLDYEKITKVLNK